MGTPVGSSLLFPGPLGAGPAVPPPAISDTRPFAAGAFTRMILRYLPVVVLVRRLLAFHGSGRYQLIEDTYLPLEPEGNFFLRDRRPLRAGVIVEHNAAGRRDARDPLIKRELREWLEQAGRGRREYALLSFSPKMYDRYGFDGQRPCFLLVWTADRQPLEQMLKKREDRRELKTWKRNLLASPLAPRRQLEYAGGRAVPMRWEERGRVAYARAGSSDGATLQKLSERFDDDKFRMTLTAAPATTGAELEERVRQWKERDHGAELSLCTMELSAQGRLRLWTDGFTPIVFRAQGRDLFVGADGATGTEGAHMKQIRGRLRPGDRVLILPGTPREHERTELETLIGQGRDEFARRARDLLDRRGEGRGLVFEFAG